MSTITAELLLFAKTLEDPRRAPELLWDADDDVLQVKLRSQYMHRRTLEISRRAAELERELGQEPKAQLKVAQAEVQVETRAVDTPEIYVSAASGGGLTDSQGLDMEGQASCDEAGQRRHPMIVVEDADEDPQAEGPLAPYSSMAVSGGSDQEEEESARKNKRLRRLDSLKVNTKNAFRRNNTFRSESPSAPQPEGGNEDGKEHGSELKDADAAAPEEDEAAAEDSGGNAGTSSKLASGGKNMESSLTVGANAGRRSAGGQRGFRRGKTADLGTTHSPSLDKEGLKPNSPSPGLGASTAKRGSVLQRGGPPIVITRGRASVLALPQGPKGKPNTIINSGNAGALAWEGTTVLRAAAGQDILVQVKIYRTDPPEGGQAEEEGEGLRVIVFLVKSQHQLQYFAPPHLAEHVLRHAVAYVSSPEHNGGKENRRGSARAGDSYQALCDILRLEGPSGHYELAIAGFVPPNEQAVNTAKELFRRSED